MEICLPAGMYMTDEDMMYIVGKIKEAILNTQLLCRIINDSIMSLKEVFDAMLYKVKNPYADMGEALIENIDLYGLGVQPKSDLEALLFHCICNAIEDQYDDNIQELDYVLMQMLRISPAKLRSLRVTRSAKFLNNLDWHDPKNQMRILVALKNAPIGNGNINEGKIHVVISDPHTQNLIERMVEEKKGVLDKTFSSRVLVLNAKQFLDVVADIYGDGTQDGYEETIRAIKEEAHDIHSDLTKENILEEFQKAFNERAFSKIIEIGGKVAKKAVLHRLLGS